MSSLSLLIPSRCLGRASTRFCSAPTLSGTMISHSCNGAEAEEEVIVLGFHSGLCVRFRLRLPAGRSRKLVVDVVVAVRVMGRTANICYCLLIRRLVCVTFPLRAVACRRLVRPNSTDSINFFVLRRIEKEWTVTGLRICVCVLGNGGKKWGSGRGKLWGSLSAELYTLLHKEGGGKMVHYWYTLLFTWLCTFFFGSSRE